MGVGTWEGRREKRGAGEKLFTLKVGSLHLSLMSYIVPLHVIWLPQHIFGCPVPDNR